MLLRTPVYRAIPIPCSRVTAQDVQLTLVATAARQNRHVLAPTFGGGMLRVFFRTFKTAAICHNGWRLSHSSVNPFQAQLPCLRERVRVLIWSRTSSPHCGAAFRTNGLTNSARVRRCSGRRPHLHRLVRAGHMKQKLAASCLLALLAAGTLGECSMPHACMHTPPMRTTNTRRLLHPAVYIQFCCM